MATFRNRNGKWQVRVQIKGHAALSKTFINKADAERWAKQIEVELQKGSYTNLMLAERSTKSAIFKSLLDLGNHVGLFYTQLKTRGRPSSGYVRLNLKDPEELALAILRTLSKK